MTPIARESIPDAKTVFQQAESFVARYGEYGSPGIVAELPDGTKVGATFDAYSVVEITQGSRTVFEAYENYAGQISVVVFTPGRWLETLAEEARLLFLRSEMGAQI